MKLKSCSQCGFINVERMYTADSFEFANDWFCKAKDGKKIAGYVETFDKPLVPDWCPLRKAGMIDCKLPRKTKEKPSAGKS